MTSPSRTSQLQPPSGSAERAEMDAITLEAIAEADAGLLVPWEAVDAWIGSWGTERERPVPAPPVTGPNLGDRRT